MNAFANTIRINRTVSAAAILAAGLALHGAPASAGEELIVVERATSDAVTDLGDKGDSVGDVLTSGLACRVRAPRPQRVLFTGTAAAHVAVHLVGAH